MSKWQWLKRGMDLVVSLLAILIVFPLLLLLSIGIYLEDRGPIFYKQQRVGKHETLFTLYKLRSMRVNEIPPHTLGAIKHQHALVTKIGYILRRFKLDELPQLINIVKGEMSIVGPRPCLPSSLLIMTAKEKKRFMFLPGLTGWAEVNGNVELSWAEQVLLDIWYINHWTFWLDLKIILKTISVVLLGSHRNEDALSKAKRFS